MTVELIPLNKLSIAKGNVRKTAVTDGLDEMKASILSVGLLNPLTVQKGEKGERRVIAGQRRTLALRALHKEGHIPEDHPVPCTIVDGDADATEISLAENVVRLQMHPADQFDAWRELADKGASIPDIAAKFGASEAVVAKRLKLSRVSPVLLDIYRKGEMTLEQVQALTLTDDHTVQETLWNSTNNWTRNPNELRRALTQGEIPTTDKRVKFVGLEAYEGKGGTIRRDLFADNGGGYVDQPQLLDTLVAEKLEVVAEHLRAEGWKWVEVTPDFDYQETYRMTQVYPTKRALTQEAREEIAALETEMQSLEELDELTDEQEERVNAIEERMESLHDAGASYKPEDYATAGSFVSIGSSGSADIRRGYVKPEDAKAKAAQDAIDRGETPEAEEDAGMPASLIEDLTAQRTAALRVELARNPHVALAVTVHALGIKAYYGKPVWSQSCLRISTDPTNLDPLIKHREQSPAWLELTKESRPEGLPEGIEDFWQYCLDLDQSHLLAHLALLVSRSVDALQFRSGGRANPHADHLADVLALDMTEHFKPTAETYFSRLPKPAIIAALEDMNGGPLAYPTDKMKKAKLAASAARAAELNPSWLPELLRAEA